MHYVNVFFNLNALNILFKGIITAGTLKCCGTEDCKVVALGCWKTKKLICGMEGKNIVAYDRLPYPAYHCYVLFMLPVSSVSFVLSLLSVLFIYVVCINYMILVSIWTMLLVVYLSLYLKRIKEVSTFNSTYTKLWCTVSSQQNI